ncbi:M56 family metallopeptidase [uncultured Clostridium sp.]|uniref:M56 family metallopeptidase n=1 Tax=uncultured Clostridium sp. TaxID=59620 RepID=UPI0025D1E2D6|nr:M56 family metallopeptidase [uncultured Clostridium sp.]
MGFLEQCFLVFFQTSLTAGIFILFVLAFLRIFGNKVSIQMKYTLWSIIFIRLIVPVMPQTNVNYNNIGRVISNFQSNNTETLIDSDNNSSISKSNKAIDINEKLGANDYVQENINEDSAQYEKNNVLKIVVDVAAVLWCAGMAVLAFTLILSLVRFKKEFKYLEKVNDENVIKILNKLKNSINLKSNIGIYRCDNRKSPCIYGIIKPKIYLPKCVLKLDESMLSHILLHELIHYKRKDLYINVLNWITLLLHWFNPLVWIAIKKIKVHREYACDCCVLESLGDEENIDYGMTIINLSKLFIQNKGIQFGLGFERSNIIKGRIEMVKRFKKGSFKISVKAALGCLVAAAVVCANGIIVNAVALDNSSVENAASQTSIENKHEFLVDSTIKVYESVSKTKEIAGFDFKLPENILGCGKPEAYQIIKISDDSNAIDVHFHGNNIGFTLDIFKDEPTDALRKIFEIYNTLDGTINRDGDTFEYNKEQMNIGNVEGYSITQKVTTPERIINGNTIPSEMDEGKYFVWENDGLWYGISYSSKYESNGEVKEFNDLEYVDLEKIASSLKNIDEIKNIDYLTEAEEELSIDTGIMNVYDKGDLQKAEEKLGFNAKFPVIIKDKVIQDSLLEITSDSDIYNNNINYQLINYYKDDNNRISFAQSKHDNCNQYNSAKNNGYIVWDGNRVYTNKVEIDGHEVYRIMEKGEYEGEPKEIITVYYFWEEDGIYYGVTLLNTDGYHDEIVGEFMNSKTID